MPPFARVIVIVLDSVGIGALPDAQLYGDAGSNTLGHIAERVPLQIPVLRSMGLDRLVALDDRPPGSPTGAYGRMAEASAGKDSVTGHWEMMGVVLEHPFPTFPARISPRPDRGVRAPHRARHARQRRGVRHRDYRPPGPRARPHRQANRLYLRRQRVSDCCARGRDSGAGVVPNLWHSVRTVCPRSGGRQGHRASVRRHARRIRSHRESSRLCAGTHRRNASRPTDGTRAFRLSPSAKSATCSPDEACRALCRRQATPTA